MTSKKFHEVIWGICEKRIIPLDRQNPGDASLIDDAHGVAMDVCTFLKKEPIVSDRVNEVGNKIEPYVINFFNRLPSYNASIPLGKVTGYPDILLEDSNGRYTYLECKTHNANNLESAFRSFYFSPSDNFKVVHDARHLVIGFEILNISERHYRSAGFKIVDAYNLQCTLKEEWNSSNKLLYNLPILSQYRE